MKTQQTFDERTLSAYIDGERDTASQWHQSQAPFMITVTPVRTDKGGNGLYYRENRLEVTTDTVRNQVNGLAYRDASGNWKTKALYF